ncbi:MAG TPA: hypothetical protein VK173_07135 [Lacibacter sp.]|nr:hypothetical protein [Lacibacter sp.]
MLKHYSIVTAFATIYLLVYVVLLQLNWASNVTWPMFFLSPVLLVSLAYSIIRYGKYSGRELNEDQEWGYSDRPDKTGK